MAVAVVAAPVRGVPWHHGTRNLESEKMRGGKLKKEGMKMNGRIEETCGVGLKKCRISM